MFDLIIKNGDIVDGTGRPRVKADVGLVGERIKAIGNLKDYPTKETIEAQGLVVSPGFIDMHSHSDIYLIVEPTMKEKIRQGVTTEVIGVDGLSVVPVGAGKGNLLRDYVTPLSGNFRIEWNWSSLKDYFKRLEKQGIALNVASLVGQGSIRIAVLGFEDRKPTTPELEEMKRLTEQAMEEGAVGLSSGLIYTPGSYASNEEIGELCRVVAKREGFYATHMRNESDRLIESVQESIKISRETGIPLHISHHKASGKFNWGKSEKTLTLFEEARKEGLDISCDQYPYIAGSSMLSAILPQWSFTGGMKALRERLRSSEIRKRIKREFQEGIAGWDNIVKSVGWDNIVIAGVSKESNKILEGKSMSAIAKIMGKEDPADAAFDLLIAEEGSVIMIVFQQDEDDLVRIMQYPFTMVGSDGIFAPGKPHPRLYGTFPRILGRYVREKKILSLEEAIRKMTFLPAARLGIKGIGLVKEGMYADIVIFDPAKIIDKATYEEPCQYPEGIEYVIVSGKIVVKKGVHTGAFPGRILRKGG